MEYLRGELTKSQERVIYLESLIFNSTGLTRTNIVQSTTIEPTTNRVNWKVIKRDLEHQERLKNSKTTTIVDNTTNSNTTNTNTTNDTTIDSSINELEQEVLDG